MEEPRSTPSNSSKGTPERGAVKLSRFVFDTNKSSRSILFNFHDYSFLQLRSLRQPFLDFILLNTGANVLDTGRDFAKGTTDLTRIVGIFYFSLQDTPQ